VSVANSYALKRREREKRERLSSIKFKKIEIGKWEVSVLSSVDI
jgi:hypothetical protein